MKATEKPLRILAIVNLPWDPRLGAARVWIELSKEWERAGHVVEKYTLTDAYPTPPSARGISALRQVLFPRKAAAYVRQNAGRFDVVDCLIGTLPFSKKSLGFRGLLVARSVGLYRLYDRFMRAAERRWPDQPKGRWFGRLLHSYVEWQSRRDSDRSVRKCDLLNLPNDDERLELALAPDIRARAVVEPYGLNEEFRHALATAAAPAEARRRGQKICFIGMWGTRKGSRDWPTIIATIRQRHPAAQFLFLGTMFDEATVRAELGAASEHGVVCRRTFEESDLPALLSDCALAIFPSYIEGFGLAVLEQLAAGLPTLAYDVSGPRQILPPHLLTPVGEPALLAARGAEILDLSLAEYERLARECQTIADGYRWAEIASDTVEEYRQSLQSLGRIW